MAYAKKPKVDAEGWCGLTITEEQDLLAVIHHGTVAAASAATGRVPETLYHHLRSIRGKLEVATTEQAMVLYCLDRITAGIALPIYVPATSPLYQCAIAKHLRPPVTNSLIGSSTPSQP